MYAALHDSNKFAVVMRDRSIYYGFIAWYKELRMGESHTLDFFLVYQQEQRFHGSHVKLNTTIPVNVFGSVNTQKIHEFSNSLIRNYLRLLNCVGVRVFRMYI